MFRLLNFAPLALYIVCSGCSVIVQWMDLSWILMLALWSWQSVFILSFTVEKKLRFMHCDYVPLPLDDTLRLLYFFSFADNLDTDIPL